MKQIKIIICTGTTCYVMGAAQLLSIKDIIQNPRVHITLEASPCLGLCKNNQFQKAPFVKINDEVISEASIDKIRERVAFYAGEGNNDNQ